MLQEISFDKIRAHGLQDCIANLTRGGNQKNMFAFASLAALGDKIFFKFLEIFRLEGQGFF